MEKPRTDGTSKSRIRVKLPSKPPLLYPQAARVLRRIVVRLAQARRGTDNASRSEEKAS
jgi:hypothetical protein